MKARSILFSGPMVRALLESRKTQTRRVVKPQPEHGVSPCHYTRGGWAYAQDDGGCTDKEIRCPYGLPGDLLWVRETWAGDDQCGVVYRADHPDVDIASGALDDGEQQLRAWRPSIFMPRWASRLTLRIKAIRVERLNDISEADAQAEGVARFKVAHPNPTEYPADWYPETHRHSYKLLWDQINGKGSWAANPWVWVVEFEVIKNNVDAVLKEAA